MSEIENALSAGKIFRSTGGAYLGAYATNLTKFEVRSDSLAK